MEVKNSPVEELKKEAETALKNVHNSKELEDFRNVFLGRKGKLPMFLRGVADMSIEGRRTLGSAGNALRQELEEALAEKGKNLDDGAHLGQVSNDGLDISRPGKKLPKGHAHVLTRALHDVRSIFRSMGYTAVQGPEIETEWYNFDALNIPKHHPAREMQDTFWLRQGETNDPKKRLLPRTHISGMQVRYMEAHEPPFRIYYEGRVFRHEATDATHGAEFFQIETLIVDKSVSVANFKFIAETFLKKFFKKKDLKVRLRPAYFPFVEPGFEIDMTCVRCGGKKCTLCTTGWVEIAGAGMVHQNVFKAAGYPPSEWQGIAFAFGLDRLVMLKHQIPDLRLLYGGDLRFIEQF